MKRMSKFRAAALRPNLWHSSCRGDALEVNYYPEVEQMNTTTERTGSRNAAATQRLAEKAHQTVDRAAEVATEAEETLRDSAARAAETLRAGEERAVETLDEGMAKVRTYVEKNPLASAGIAFAAGVLVSMLLRR
jgi:ElaB/YqjD/DUF883 family membrane-anchored ribosome-binding protein